MIGIPSPAGTAPAPHPAPPGHPSTPRRRSLLRPLGIVGYDDLEPVLLAALATEEPLLLVSDHGAAKTLLLVRLAAALGVELRHYNASLLQFDDLVGFPIPDERGGIRYAAGPGAIWDAGAVFFDEIGRCRPETANKLFPIVHERRVQGVPLERLRFRWAATNPPAEALDGDRLDDPYEGVEALDAALADRFSYVVRIPRFADLSDEDRAAVVRGAGERTEPDGHRRVRELVAATRDLLPPVAADLGEGSVAYVLALCSTLAAAGITIGGRRAATLRRNLLAVSAASLALGRTAGERSHAAAVLSSIPDVVRRPIPRSVLLAAHRAAWECANLPAGDPRRLLNAVADPVRRALLAITLPRLAMAFRGEVLCSALATMAPFEADLVSWHLFPRLARERLVPAAAVETVAGVVGRVAEGGIVVRGFGPAAGWVAQTRRTVAATRLDPEGAEYLFGVVCHRFPPPNGWSGAADAASREPVERCLAVWRACEEALGGAADAPAAREGA
jgi:MoxR-like ATPase